MTSLFSPKFSIVGALGALVSGIIVSRLSFTLHGTCLIAAVTPRQFLCDR